MTNDKSVDVCMQCFGKPWQTALTLLTLEKYTGTDINNIFFLIEPARPKNDLVDLSVLDGIVPKMKTVLLPKWVGLNPIDYLRINDNDYRLSLRYQYAFEHSKADYLLILHNDIIFKKNIITPFIKNITTHIAIGEVGQCWNCPLKRVDVVQFISKGEKKSPCNREKYDQLRFSFDELSQAYEYAEEKGYSLRYKAKEALTDEYRINPWPFPECRVNEWCCMINLKKAREITIPIGNARPFGAYIKGHDLGSAWFRDMHHNGFTVKNMNLTNYIIHTTGHRALFDSGLYKANEMKAMQIIKRAFPRAYKMLVDKGLI